MDSRRQRPNQPSDPPIVQHLAAGVVFAAAAAEILPDVLHANAPVFTLASAVLGVAAMVGLQMLEGPFEGPVGLSAVAGVDVLVDGFVLGLAFVHGAKQGLLPTIALTLELLFLGLSVATAFGEEGKQPSKAKVIGATGGIALALPVGAAIGLLLGGLP